MMEKAVVAIHLVVVVVYLVAVSLVIYLEVAAVNLKKIFDKVPLFLEHNPF